MHELAGCIGLSPLEAKWDTWMRDCLRRPHELAAIVAEFRSPVHLHFPHKMSENTAELIAAAKTHGIDLQIYFARKANKCLAYVDEAITLGIGVDTASFNEMHQCVQRNLPGKRIVYSAAVKEVEAIDLAIAIQATIVIDNLDELEFVKQRLRNSTSGCAVLALRLRNFVFPNGKHRSRFGVDCHDAIGIIRDSLDEHALSSRMRWKGLHFHLDGLDTDERIAALHQSLDLVVSLRQLGVPLEFVDMGGGFPVCYLQHESQWHAFREHIDRQIHDSRMDRITATGEDSGSTITEGRVTRSKHIYPYWQPLSAAQWLDGVLGSTDATSISVAQRLLATDVQLRCEPGRSLMNGCGMTIARVAFRKLDSEGNMLVGLAMNGTNCRTTAVDFSVDPSLLQTGLGPRTETADGYLVGAYCTESEYITPRKFRFHEGVAIDDLVVFPNTAGYQMHFMESRSHQFDLPANVILDGKSLLLSNKRLDPETVLN